MMRDVQEKTGVFLFSVNQLEGYTVDEYYGLVVGKTLYGAHFLKDWLARVADTFGGHVRGYESALQSTMESAAMEMARQAASLGANAIIGIDFDTGAVGGRMMLASCYGTAVRVRPAQRHTPHPT